MQFSGKTFKMFLKKLGTIALLSDEHPLKASLPISVTLFGIVIFVIDEHS